MSSTVVRYSDAELEEFKQVIMEKYEKAKEQLRSLQEQILDITENSSDEHGGDWVDDSSINNEVEMLNNMAIRQRMYLKELENALIRIRNKSYGICTITGKLIDKKRLMAVPTTTKSLEGKASEPGRKTEAEGPKRRPARGKKKAGTPKERKVITKVIRKPSKPATRPVIDDDEEDDDLVFDDKNVYYGDDEEEDNMTDSMGDLDDFADKDSESDDVDF
jgi:RNA polymerase-binding transcription factor DksA